MMPGTVAGAGINGHGAGSEVHGGRHDSQDSVMAVSDRRTVFFLWLAMLALCVFFACIQPVWSRVDEAQHFHYVQYIMENSVLPVEGTTFISPEVVDVSLREGQWGWKSAGTISTPLRLDSSKWIGVPENLDDAYREKWVQRNLWYFNYEAMQPPLYYLVNVPVYAATPGDSLAKLYAMRLLAALFASSMVPITWLFAREAFPQSRLVTLGAPVVLTQGYTLNMSQVSNDVLAVPLAAASLLFLLRIVARGLDWKRSVMAGALIGASLLSKLTTIFLLPVALLALSLLIVYRREVWSRVLVHAGIIYGTVMVTLAPWLLRNLVVYGDATGASAARPLMSSFFRSPTISLDTLRLEELLPTYWFGEPVFPFPFWTYAWFAVFSVMMVAAVGLLFYFTHGEEQDRDARRRVMFVSLAFIMGLAVNMLLPFGSGIGGVPGRYLYPVMPAMAFLLMFGVQRLLSREKARFLVEITLVWLIVWESLNLLAYIQSR
ncbi:MAG: glycosyltransferase family 39 protein [Thermoleophilia bacterium]|jgi:4-amino-4-deoxy-L-arabinose transferase-like glycosyltransferase